MDTCLPDWNTDIGGEFPAPLQKKSMGLENELVELLWQNGEIVLHHSQTNRKQSYDPSKLKQVRDPNPNTNPNPTSLIQDDETVSWMDCPIDESFERDFCANFLSEIPPFDESNKKLDGERVFKFGASKVNQDFAPPPPPPPAPRFQAVEATHQPQLPVRSRECSGMTIGASHCASNQVVNEVDMSWASSCGIGSRTTMSAGAREACRERINEGGERGRGRGRGGLGQARTSCSGGSDSSLWKTSSLSNDTSRHKRKSRDLEESEFPSDATESESAAGNKASQKSGSNRRSRVAEVHNMSERRRRDRINEKMRALQELIPHANKSDKASMLDEAIEYMKSLQLQIQLMWMGRGMAPMMLPGMQQYMSRVGMGIGPPVLPAIHNLMRLSRLPLVDQAMSMANQAPAGQNPMLNLVNYPNQMQSSSFQEQYANYMNFHSMQNVSPQPTNMFNFGIHPSQQNQVTAPRGNGNTSVG